MKKEKLYHFWVTPVCKGNVQVLNEEKQRGEVILSSIKAEQSFYGTVNEFREFLERKEKEAEDAELEKHHKSII